jgi:hypothetical protein
LIAVCNAQNWDDTPNTFEDEYPIVQELFHYQFIIENSRRWELLAYDCLILIHRYDVSHHMTDTEELTAPLKETLQSDDVTRLNITMLLAQGGWALKKGNKQRAALLFGMAALASRHKRLTYAMRGALMANDIRKKLT